MRFKTVMIILLFCFVCQNAMTESRFGLTASAGLDIPMTNRNIYNPGGSGTIAGAFRLGNISNVRTIAHIDFSMTSTSAISNVTALSLGTGFDALFPLSPRMDFRTFVTGGYGFFFYEGDTYGSPFIRADIQLLFNLSPAFRLGVSGGYKHFFPDTYSGITAGLSAVITLGTGTGSAVDVDNILLNPLFPVLYKFYDDNSFGAISISNGEKGPISDVKVSLFIENYMDSPKECITIGEMKRNEVRDVPLYALFNETVLDITEGTRVQAEISVEYEYLDTVRQYTNVQSIRLYDRNAMTWDDDNKAAAFITAKDPSVLEFSKNYAGLARSPQVISIDRNFSMAMGIYEALRLFGMNYIRDPLSPYDVLSENELAIDYLQFPSQTLQYKAGDCDDLSILYSSLLEAAGIESAFITVPGHIYIAFALKSPPEEAARIFDKPEDLIYRENKAWIPVEVTLLDQGFLKSWATGLSQWNKYEDNKGFYPIHSAWEIYEPVGFSSGSGDLKMPDTETYLSRLSEELDTFVQRQIQSRKADLLAQLETSTDKGRIYNKLGVLYARFGLYDQAELEFKKGATLFSDTSIINLGNIHFLKGEYEEARETFSRALERRPDSAVSKLGLAKASYELNQFEVARQLYRDLIEIKPQWASEFAYLDTGREYAARASDQRVRESTFWAEE